MNSIVSQYSPLLSVPPSSPHSHQLMDHLLAICGELGSISDGCSALVTVNLNDIYNFLTTQIDPDSLCNLFGETCPLPYTRKPL